MDLMIVFIKKNVMNLLFVTILIVQKILTIIVVNALSIVPKPKKKNVIKERSLPMFVMDVKYSKITFRKKDL